MPDNIHATAIALWLARRGQYAWRGVLIQGASGMGKSDLALRLMQLGARLVADDRSQIWASGSQLYVRCPDTIAGKIEARTLGILDVPYLPMSRVEIVIQLTHDAIDRLPEPRKISLCDIDLPLLTLDPRPFSAPTLVVQALEAL